MIPLGKKKERKRRRLAKLNRRSTAYVRIAPHPPPPVAHPLFIPRRHTSDAPQRHGDADGGGPRAMDSCTGDTCQDESRAPARS